ncbi:hypothetical protein M6B38_192100 [Iris pallida]|uniref:Uncharacterized protein n=1 Tax=Iris pallida TaxID=29817 RepID=A0AAX6EEU5_IRIPA|nr:hypothetical protein M6B38_192100 [Iris pallida]
MTGDPRSCRTTKVCRSGPLGGGGVLFWVTVDLARMAGGGDRSREESWEIPRWWWW